MLHVWLIPAVLVAFLVVIAFYLVLRTWGGNGVRTDGQTLLDKPEEDPPLEE